MKYLLLLSSLILLNCDLTLAKTEKVRDAASLKTALKNAEPGTVIELAAGDYTGKFIVPAGVSGTGQSPIVLKGGPGAVLSAGDTTTGYGLHLQGNRYWRLEGFTISYSKKGLVLDRCDHITISGLQVNHVGEEGIHIRTFSTHNIIEQCTVTHTGLLSPGFGEACYIGSAINNWEKYSNGGPDTCNHNIVRNNVFGPFVTAEGIDIKEGTTANLVTGNTFYGKGQLNINSGNSWMEVKGNNNIIEHNTGYDALEDGYQVTIKAPGWGANNIFRNNKGTVNAKGYAFKIQLKDGMANGNRVLKNNEVTGAGAGMTNIELSE